MTTLAQSNDPVFNQVIVEPPVEKLNSPMAGLLGSGLFVVIFAVVLLDMILKGIALWKAARNNQSWWFVALLIFQSAGILPILYLLVFKKDKNKVEVVAAAPVVTTVTKSATK